MYKVLLPGEALIDKFSNNKDIINKPGGAPANVAAAIAKLGVSAKFLGSIGKDDYGQLLKKTMIKNNVNVDGLVFVDAKTTAANVFLDAQGERSFSFERGADELFELKLLPEGILEDYNILHLGSATAMMGGKLWESYLEILGLSKNKIVIFDPNYRDALYKDDINSFIDKSYQIIKHSDIVKVSIEELKILSNTNNTDKGVKIIIDGGAKIVLVTLGKDGTLFVSDKYNLIIPSVKVKQVDTTGAGDAFIGYLIGQIAKAKLNKHNIDSEAMLSYIRKANICASITVTKFGALEAIPTQEEVEHINKDNPWD